MKATINVDTGTKIIHQKCPECGRFFVLMGKGFDNFGEAWQEFEDWPSREEEVALVLMECLASWRCRGCMVKSLQKHLTRMNAEWQPLK